MKFGCVRAAAFVALSSCTAAQPPRATPPPPPLEAATDCEPKRGFDGYGLLLFVATEAQLHELVGCRYLGLSLGGRPEDAPKIGAGACAIREHSSYALHLRRSSEVTLEHLGLTLGTSELAPAPWDEEMGDWPPQRLQGRGGTDSPLGVLYEFPSEFVAKLARIDEPERALQAQALEQRLTRFWPHLWAPATDSQAACTGYLQLLAEVAQRARVEHAQLFVLELTTRDRLP